MSRVLTIRRVTVPLARSEEYRSLVAALATRLALQQQHLWLFELHGTPGTWLEFVEGAGDRHHRAVGPADAESAALEAALLALAPATDAATEIWDEARLPHS
ncbi:MAG: hypothetical protein ABIZ70_06080 [Gemmatimonadales bacterium]